MSKTQNIKNLRVVVFDWDNTLVESRSALEFCVNQVLQKFELPEWKIIKEKRDDRLSFRDNFPLIFGDKAKEAYEKAHTSSLTYSRITQALADDYFSIYCINVEDDSFIEYSTSEEYEKLGIEKDGKDFFNVSRKNILRIDIFVIPYMYIIIQYI